MGRRKNAASDAAAPTPDPVELPLASSVAISECLIAVVEYVVIASMQGTLIRASHLGNGPVGNAAAVCAGVTLLAWMLYRQATTYDVSIARLLHMFVARCCSPGVTLNAESTGWACTGCRR